MARKIAIVGAGAVGGYAGAHMVQAGEDVTFIDPWPVHVEHMRKHGLRVTHAMEVAEFSVPVRALDVTDAQQLAKEKPVDIAFVCMKSYDTAWATMLIRQYLAADGYVVSLQNCMNEETIAGIVGWGRRSAASRAASPSICRSRAISTAGPARAALITSCFAPARFMAALPRGPKRCAAWSVIPTAPR
ncbi:ketopantoate reductase family protein [Bradyrhizobium sp. 13971]